MYMDVHHTRYEILGNMEQHERREGQIDLPRGAYELPDGPAEGMMDVIEDDDDEADGEIEIGGDGM
jgi:hypothetical protein